jgi:c-di-GMP-binding flagellar brake protein YcgR
MEEGGQSERRTGKRVTFIQEVEVDGLGKRRCLDIAIGGMYLESAVSFPPNTVIDLSFNLQGSDPRPLRIKARVMYVHEGVGMGLAFVDLSEADAERIRQFTEQS